MNNLRPSANCYAIIKNFEKFRPTAYKPTKNDVWTAGWGHTHGVTATTTCDQNTAQEWLLEDVEASADDVSRECQVPLSQNQFDALVSLCFNIPEALSEQHTLMQMLNARNYAAAADQFLRWDYQAGTELAGLKARREQERALFLRA